jgi:hypothetical protein
VHVHRETVINVMDAFAAEIADYEKRVTAKLRRCKWLLLDRIEREGDAIPRQALGLTFKIVSDQEATDSGRAIARVDHVHHVDLFSDFPTFVAELEARPVMDEKNGADGIGLSGGKNLPLPAPAADPAAIAHAHTVEEESVAGPGVMRARDPQADWKSDVLGLATQQDQANLPTLATDSPAAPTDSAAAVEREERERDRDREGGGSRAPAPSGPAIDKTSQKILGNGI